MGVITYQVPEGVKRMTIGVQGEANVREFLFDVTEWRQITGDLGTAEMVVQRRGDSSPYAAAITMHDENTVSWVPTAADTAKDGVGKLQLMWIASGQTVKTKIFDMKVDPALDYDLPDDSLDPWASWMPDVINAAAEIGSLETQVDTRLDSQDAAIAAIRAAVGSPLVANTAAAMTDTEKVYVYTGTESGFTAGNWYYYNGAAWVSGGVYNSAAVETDTTLSVSGVPADAKAAGHEIADVKSAIGYEKTLIDLSEYTVINGVIQSDGTWGGHTSDSYQSALITDIPQEIIVKADSVTKDSTFSFFSEVPNQPATATSNVYFCASETGRHTVEHGNTEKFSVPADCKCIVVAIRSQASGIITIINGISTKIKDEILTPQSFGAKGDGVTDDTAAFVALDGKTAFIPEGTYVVSHVQYGRKTSLFGAGMGKTIIVQKAGETRDLFDFADADSCVLTYVTLQGQSGETSSNDYRALLKIRTTVNHTNFSNYSNFEHLGIIDSPASGIVLLGINSEDPAHPNSKNNWVHHINDIRVERCKLWCMIDETSDNLFSNLYLSEGDKGCLLTRKASSNMYSNLKLDQPYYAGSGGNLSGYNDGALLLVRNCGNIRFVNIDLQSAYYVGAKMYGSNRIHFDGNINNCGIGANGEGIGLAIKESQNCTFNIAFGYHNANQRQKYNAKIDIGCSNVSVYANEHYATENLNACPDSCFIENPSRISPLYNSQSIDKLITLDANLFSNPLCDSLDGWRGTTGFSIDSNDKTVGTNSFKVVGDSSESYGIYQTFNNVVAGDHYLILCMVNIEQKSTIYADSSAKTAYIISNSGGIDSYSYSKYSIAPNTVGKHLLMKVCVAQNDKIEPQFHVYKNNGVYFFGNFMLLNLNEAGLSFPMSENMYDAIYSQLKTIMNNPFSGASVSVPMDYSQVMNILRTLIQS